jgi:hypothetical protein
MWWRNKKQLHMQRLKAKGFGISGNFAVKSGIACGI